MEPFLRELRYLGGEIPTSGFGVKDEAIMDKPVCYDQIPDPKNQVIAGRLFKHFLINGHFRCLAFHQQNRLSFPVVSDNITSPAEPVKPDLLLDQNQ